MFFEPSRITSVRRMILAEDGAGRAAALAELLPEQRADFEGIFRVMAGLPVTIRLLDPPLHEFLPHDEAGFADVAEATGLSVTTVRRRIGELHEFNPMLGHRGCRLGITYPEIYAMQARAIFEAAVAVAKDTGEAVVPEVMVPLVATARELEITKAVIDAEARDVFTETGRTLDYLVGTMIELPRAALRAGDIAAHAEFFSFGTNDLTQTALGISRDDAARFLGRLCRTGHLSARSVRRHRRGRRGRTGRRSPPIAAARRDPRSSWASAANMAATRRASPFARSSGSIMSAARRIGCRSRGWRRRRRR